MRSVKQPVQGKDTNYFVIDTVAGTYTESLYVSFPKEGGFRIQSLHELQKKNGVNTPEKSNVGLFEPSALEKITYTTDGNAVKMTGTDGTVVKYTQSSTGFALTIYKENDDKIVSLTNKQFSFAYNRKGEVVRSMVEFRWRIKKLSTAAVSAITALIKWGRPSR